MFIVRHKNIFFIFSGVIAAFAVFSILFFGFKTGIEFTGGSLLEVSYGGEMPSPPIVTSTVEGFLGEKSSVQELGTRGFLIRTRELAVSEHAELFSLLSFDGKYAPKEERYTLVGPSVGEELRAKAWYAILAVLFAITLFVTFAFRKKGKDTEAYGPPGWQYGLITIIALAHDVIVPTGVFAFLATRFLGAEVNTLFITALLAILGYSVHDTIVVFDRIREHVRRNGEERAHEPLAETIGKSLRETYVRSLNTSLTTLLALLALIFFGGSSVFYFALLLAVGVVAGTYSSSFP